MARKVKREKAPKDVKITKKELNAKKKAVLKELTDMQNDSKKLREAIVDAKARIRKMKT